MTLEAEIYKNLCSIPSFSDLINIKKNKEILSLTISTTKRDFCRKEKLCYSNTIDYNLNTRDCKVEFPLEIDSSYGLSQVSGSGKVQVKLRTLENKRYVEVIRNSLVDFIQVTKVHGPFYNDSFFGSISFNVDETKIIYVVEPTENEEDSRFDYEPDAGEGYTGKNKPCAVILDLVTQEAVLLSDMPFFGVGSPIFGPNGEHFYFIGVEKEPMRLGMKFCVNRKTGLFRACLDGSNITRLGDDAMNARYPIMVPDGKRICYLSNQFGGPHDSCAKLMMYDLDTGNISTIVDVVNDSFDYNTFPGIFATSLNQKCWFENESEHYLLINSSWRSKTVIIAVGIKSKRVINLTSDGKDSWVLLGVCEGIVIGVKSSITSVPSIMALSLSQKTLDENLVFHWEKIYQFPISQKVSELIDGLEYSIHTIDGQSMNLEVIIAYNTRKFADKSPLIVMPHGGPHSAFSTAYNLSIAGFTALGYSCMLVNYSGSIGFGNSSVYSLIGKIGTLDVQETHAAAVWASRLPFIDINNIFLNGGSHGGYITAHLVARESSFYRGGMLRNPVINVGQMISNSDIPDWCYGESGINFDSENPVNLTAENYTKMLKLSPIYHISDKVSPILLFIGLLDRRVPPSQGFRWAEILKGKNQNIQ